jgi:hypothetical protein
MRKRITTPGRLRGKGHDLARMFHEGDSIAHVFAKRINLMGKHLGIFVQGQFAPIHFQEKCAVTA